MNIPCPPGRAYLPYQLKGIRYALGARGTIIGDEMGLGKTVQAIGVINATPGTPRVLIVCPAGLKLNWWNELCHWRTGKMLAYVKSYHQAGDEANQSTQWDILIVDEAHYIKNPDSQRSKNIERIAARAKRVLLLTGTPMENCPIELWPLLKIACPEKWNGTNPRIGVSVLQPTQKKTHPGEGPAFWEYATRYCDLKRVTYKYGDGLRSAWDFKGASNLEELAMKLRTTCMIRRLKSQVLEELPAIRRQLIVLPSKANDADLFPELTDDNYLEIVEKLRPGKSVFAEWSKRRHDQALAKVDSCLRFIGDALDESKKIIIFAHHSDVIQKLADGIAAELPDGQYVTTITGETAMRLRQNRVDIFQTEPACRVILGSIGAMGVGWTLTASEQVIFCELDPVPGRLSQAEARAHRIGQRNSVLVQHLVANGSLCARMAQIAVRKQETIDTVLNSVEGEI